MIAVFGVKKGQTQAIEFVNSTKNQRAGTKGYIEYGGLSPAANPKKKKRKQRWPVCRAAGWIKTVNHLSGIATETMSFCDQKKLWFGWRRENSGGGGSSATRPKRTQTGKRKVCLLSGLRGSSWVGECWGGYPARLSRDKFGGHSGCGV